MVARGGGGGGGGAQGELGGCVGYPRPYKWALSTLVSDVKKLKRTIPLDAFSAYFF